jgi:hypothetical protein
MIRFGEPRRPDRSLRQRLAALLGLIAMIGVVLLGVAPSLAVTKAAPCHEAMIDAGPDRHGGHGAIDPPEDHQSPVLKPVLSGTTCPVLAGFAVPAGLPFPDPSLVFTSARFVVPVTALTPVLVDGPGRPPPHLS